MGEHKYDRIEKQQAREAVHSILAQALSPNAKMLILAGTKAHEMYTAIRYGWRAENIIPVDVSRACMANFTRQFKDKPRLHRAVMRNRRVGLVSEVCRALAAEGDLLSAIHLDFCDPIESWHAGCVREEVEKVMRSGALAPDALVAITVLNGRVKGYASEEDRWTIMKAAVATREKRQVTEIGRGTYFNMHKKSKSPMIWGIFRLGGNDGNS